MKTAHKEQGKVVMDVSFVIRVVLKAVLKFKDELLQCKKCVLRCLKKYSAAVVQKKFWLRKAFNFFKNIY